MKKALYNAPYFMKEAGRVLWQNRLSGIFSFLSTGLILFILAVIVTCWSVGNLLIKTMQDEAEISAYLDLDIGEEQVSGLVETIKGIEGVQDVKLVDREEAYGRMKEILGEEAGVLGLFDENPFEAFIEVRISLGELGEIAERVEGLKGISHVRDNREVLERVQSITIGLKRFGYLIIAAVGISTLVIVSHMIRQGIYNNRVQIGTLRLLGAPESFIGFPFVLAGLLLTLAGGLLASFVIVFLINRAYSAMSGSLPFIPLPARSQLVTGLVLFVSSVSILLGVLGSLFGLRSTK
jgi:cell division transport system permease protein